MEPAEEPDASQAGGLAARALQALHGFEDVLLAVLLAAMILLATLQIVLRSVFDAGIGWVDPLVRALVLWIGLLGALAASRNDRQINVDVLSHLLAERSRATVRSLTRLATALIAAVICYHSWRFACSELEFATPAFASVPTWAVASIVPIAFGCIALRYALLSIMSARAALSLPRTEP